LLERLQDVKGAISLLKEVKLASFSNDTYEIDEIEKRLKDKKTLLKPKKKSKKKKSEKKGKKK
jgi:tRNA U34 5-carboxymethylaminomethyl modifying enzyme MnmG/GidA